MINGINNTSLFVLKKPVRVKTGLHYRHSLSQNEDFQSNVLAFGDCILLQQSNNSYIITRLKFCFGPSKDKTEHTKLT